MENKVKKNRLGIIFCLFVIIVFYITGCRTTDTRNPTTDIIQIGTAGAKAVGRLEQLHSDMERLGERERLELERITATSSNLGNTISELVRFAYGLLNEIDNLRGEVEQARKDLAEVMGNTHNLVVD